MGVFSLEGGEFIPENDVLRGANAVQQSHLGSHFALRRFSCEPSKRSDSGASSDADQVLIRFENREESPHRRYHMKLLPLFCPVHHACAHFSISLDGNFIEPAIESGGGKGISTFVFGAVRPKKGNELSCFMDGFVIFGPLESQGFGVFKLPSDFFNFHEDDILRHILYKWCFNPRVEATFRQNNCEEERVSLRLLCG